MQIEEITLYGKMTDTTFKQFWVMRPELQIDLSYTLQYSPIFLG